MKKVTVVIPNWNGEKYIDMCLTSLRNQSSDDFSVLIIDNDSKDASPEIIRTKYPEVSLICLSENTGFSGGVNEGIRRTETPYVLLLNNDVSCDRYFVEKLLKRIETDERIFSVSSRMIRYREQDLLDDCGDYYTIFGYQAQRGTAQNVVDPKYTKPCRVFSACAGAAIYRRAVFDEIGLFDENHFAYLEDVDIGYRAQLFGYYNMYEPEAEVYHVGSASSGAVQYSDFKVRLSARNNEYVIHKNMPLFYRIFNALPLFIGRTVKKRYFEKRGFGEAYAAGLRESREGKKNLKQVPFSWKKWPVYISIEHQLFVNTFHYVKEYRNRHPSQLSRPTEK